MFWRRRLPHWVPEGSIVFVTWRLAGTFPQPRPGTCDPGKAFVYQDRQLDRAADGSHWPKTPQVATIVQDALLHGEQARRAYDLYAWAIMPNHVHVVLQPQNRLAEIMRWLKTSTSVRANRLLRRTGPFWEREYYDRWIRNRAELLSIITYTEENPVSAGLVATPELWPWSSASQPAGDKIAGATVTARATRRRPRFPEYPGRSAWPPLSSSARPTSRYIRCL